MARTQEQRRAETRRRLLDAAREVVADRGVAGASVDAVAEAADRTSGALYDHFGGKDGLIVALLDEWTEATAAATVADLNLTAEPEARLRSIWTNFARPSAPGGEHWTLLEHELWLYACRQSEGGAGSAVAAAVGARYEQVRARLADALEAGLLGEDVPDREGAGLLATLMIGLMVGLEMQRRVDPDAVSDQAAVDGLSALTGAARTVPAGSPHPS